MPDSAHPSSPVRALRDAFGDPKPPDISRKITACVACRKQKIKCHMRDSQPPCVRCKKRGLSCTVNRSLQMLLEGDALWKHTLESKVQKLETALAMVAEHVQIPGLIDQLRAAEDVSTADGTPTDDVQQGLPRANHDPPQNHWDIVMDPDAGPEAPPGSYISQPITPKPRREEDLIARGVITVDKAREFFVHYQNRLDHFEYQILGDSITFEGVREASPLLTAAICMIGALHLASDDFDSCYDDFLSLSAKQTFSKRNTIHDVKALCIGAFWLSDISWTLVGAAVRIATELQLHKSFHKALNGDRGHYLRTRLYYLVYVCDHHFSIAYGRPPMTRDCEAIRNIRDFMKCQYITEEDRRLASQTLRWSLCTSIYDTFGVNVDKPLSEAEIPLLRGFSQSLNDLLIEWATKFAVNARVGNYPAKCAALQCKFVNLYLYSHAFRGSSSPLNALSEEMALELNYATNFAVSSALAIVREVISDTELQSFLNGIPTYFHVMIAFAVVFLFKISNKAPQLVRFDHVEVKREVSELLEVLKRVTAPMHQRHLLVSLTKGIDGLFQRWPEIEQQATPIVDQPQQIIGPLISQPDMLDSSVDWMDGFLDPQFMSEYDFLTGQDIFRGGSFSAGDYALRNWA